MGRKLKKKKSGYSNIQFKYTSSPFTCDFKFSASQIKKIKEKDVTLITIVIPVTQ